MSYKFITFAIHPFYSCVRYIWQNQITNEYYISDDTSYEVSVRQYLTESPQKLTSMDIQLGYVDLWTFKIN